MEELLPIGSIVILKDAKKKIMIIGIMQIKRMSDGSNVAYDYLGVPYPEGYIGKEAGLLFNHDKIQEVIFKGYSNEDREIFVTLIQKVMDKIDDKNK